MDLLGAGMGLVFGLGTSLTGIFKNKTSADWNGIEWKKALPTIILTTAAGAVVGAQGIPITGTAIDSVLTTFSAVGITEWLGNIIKGLWSRAQ